MAFLFMHLQYTCWNDYRSYGLSPLPHSHGSETPGVGTLIMGNPEASAPGLPIRRKSESGLIRHLDLRQILGVHDLVFLDHVVLEQQEGGEGVHFIGLERPLFSEGHAAIDVIPYRRGEGRVNPMVFESFTQGARQNKAPMAQRLARFYC